MTDCVSRIVGETGIDRADAEAVLNHVSEGGKREDFVRRLEYIQNKEMANVAANAAKRAERRARYKAAPSPEAGMRAMLVGSNQAFEGSRLSTEAIMNGNKQALLSSFQRDLVAGGVEEVFAQGKLTHLWTRELFELNRKNGKGSPGVTQNAQALRIAEAIQRFQKAGIDLVNREGGFIMDYDGYVAKTIHNPMKLIDLGPDRWMDLAKRTFDIQRMWPGIKEESLDKTLRGMYDELKLGKHYEAGDDAVFVPKGANIARRVSEHRTVHFATAENWLNYTREASDMSPEQIILASGLRAGRDAGLMQVWGTNPRNAFERDFNELALEVNKNGTPEQLGKLQDLEKAAKGWFDIMDGTSMRVTNKGRALALQNFLTVQRIAKLGMLPFAQVADIATLSGELKYQGVGFFDRMTGGLTAYFKGDSSQQREVARLIGAGIEGWISELSAHLEGIDPKIGGGGFTGALSSMQNFMFRWSGAEMMTNRAREAGVYMMAAHLGSRKHLDFAELSPKEQRMLGLFGLGEDAWRALQKAEWTKGRDGDTFLTPSVVNDIPVEAIDNYADLTGKKKFTQDLLKEQLEKEEKELTKLQEASTRARIAAQDAEGKESKAHQRVKAAADEAKAREKKVERTYQDAELVVSGVETRANAAKAKATEAAKVAKAKTLDAEQKMVAAQAEAEEAHKAAPSGEQLASLREKAKDDAGTAALLRRAEKAVEKADGALQRAAAAKTKADEAWTAMEGKLDAIDDEYKMAKEKAIKDAQKAQEARDQAVVMAQKADKELSKAESALDKARERTRLAQMDEDDTVRRLREVQKTPEARKADIDRRTDEALRSARDAARFQLASRLNAYYADRSKYAVLDIGVREKYALTGGHAADTTHGMAYRVLLQFKSFMVAQFLRTWGREWYGNEGLGKVSGLIGFTVFSTILGTFGEAMKQIAKGEDPAATFANSPGGYLLKGFTRGGAASIMGDFAANEFSRHGQSFGSYLAGPVGGLADSLLFAKTNVMKGEDASGSIIKLVKDQTPFQNFLWTKMATDYLVWNRLMEFANPGFLQRQRRKARENGTAFMFDGR